jgi:hypothetical protein
VRGGRGRRTADFDGRLELQQVGLAHEDLLCREAQQPDFILRELHLLAGPPVAHLQQPLDDVVDLRLVLRRRGGGAGSGGAQRARA